MRNRVHTFGGAVRGTDCDRGLAALCGRGKGKKPKLVKNDDDDNKPFWPTGTLFRGARYIHINHVCFHIHSFWSINRLIVIIIRVSPLDPVNGMDVPIRGSRLTSANCVRVLECAVVVNSSVYVIMMPYGCLRMSVCVILLLCNRIVAATLSNGIVPQISLSYDSATLVSAPLAGLDTSYVRVYSLLCV